MNLSEVVTRVKMKLGIMAIASPFEYINDSVVEIIQNVTNPVFSIYEPYKESMCLDLNDLECIEDFDYRKSYILPDFLKRKIIYLYDVRYNSSSMSGLGYYSYGMPFAQGSMINQIMLMNATANLMDLALPKMTFEFRQPRTVILYNVYTSSRLVFDFGFENDPTLATIAESAKESFIKLAILDCRDGLYQVMKQYNEYQTAHGNVTVKLEGWENAEADRDALLATWDDVYHLDVPAPTWG